MLGGRFDVFVGLGDIPFEGQRVVGRDDIRGYTRGEWRGDQAYDAQAEYRRQVAGRFGGVAFAGWPWRWTRTMRPARFYPELAWANDSWPCPTIRVTWALM